MTTYSYIPYQTAASARTNTSWASRFYSGGAVLALLSTLPRPDSPGARDAFSALSGRRGSVGGIGTGWESMPHHLALPAPNVRASFVPCMEHQLPTLSCTHKRGRMQCDERRDPWSGSNSQARQATRPGRPQGRIAQRVSARPGGANPVSVWVVSLWTITQRAVREPIRGRRGTSYILTRRLLLFHMWSRGISPGQPAGTSEHLQFPPVKSPVLDSREPGARQSERSREEPPGLFHIRE